MNIVCSLDVEAKKLKRPTIPCIDEKFTQSGKLVVELIDLSINVES